MSKIIVLAGHGGIVSVSADNIGFLEGDVPVNLKKVKRLIGKGLPYKDDAIEIRPEMTSCLDLGERGVALVPDDKSGEVVVSYRQFTSLLDALL